MSSQEMNTKRPIEIIVDALIVTLSLVLTAAHDVKSINPCNGPMGQSAVMSPFYR